MWNNNNNPFVYQMSKLSKKYFLFILFFFIFAKNVLKCNVLNCRFCGMVDINYKLYIVNRNILILC